MMMGALQRKKDEQRVVSRVFTCKARPRVSASEVIQRKGKPYNPGIAENGRTQLL